MTQSHPRPLRTKKWKKRMRHFKFGQVYQTVLFSSWCSRTVLKCIWQPSVAVQQQELLKNACCLDNKWWGKNQRHRAGRGTRVQTALQPRVQCTNLWLCSPARLAALGTLGRVGVSRCTKMAQRATIWSLSQGELRACVWPEFLQLGLLLAE